MKKFLKVLFKDWKIILPMAILGTIFPPLMPFMYGIIILLVIFRKI